MFNKKSCNKCGKKINDKDNFCPYCGNSLKENNKKDLGMLGENDFDQGFQDISKNLFGGISGGMLNKMLTGAAKMLEKEMQKTMKASQPKTNIKLMINGKEVKLTPQNKLSKKQTPKKQIKEIHQIIFDAESQKKFSNLEKTEPKTNIRRFSEKIIYEIDVPEIKSVKDISIIKLENSLEIKALSKEKAYLKAIPINFPLTNYKVSKGKLTLEFGIKG